MKPFIYGGFDPATLYWIFLGCTILMFAFFIYEENIAKVYWGKGAVIRLLVIVALWSTALILYINADVSKKGGLEEANSKVVASIEDKGLKIVSDEIDVTAGKQSSVRVELPVLKDAPAEGNAQKTISCDVFAPKDATQDIGIVCGESSKGMSLDNLVKWNEAGQPKDDEAFQNTEEETQKIVDSIA